MRTTLRLDEHLLRAAKAAAARHGHSLTAFVEEALRARLLPSSAANGRKKTIRLPTFKLKLRPNINLDDNRALRDLMDDDGKLTQC